MVNPILHETLFVDRMPDVGDDYKQEEGQKSRVQ